MTSQSSAPGWAICTATLCPCVAAMMMFFGLYGGLVVCLLAAVAIILGSSSRIAAVPAIIIACYGMSEGMWLLTRLWPWIESYSDWSWSDTLAAECMAGGLTIFSFLLFISAVVSFIRAPIYRKRQAKARQVASHNEMTPPVIVTEYTPDRKQPSPRLQTNPQQVTVIQRGYDGQLYSEPGTFYAQGYAAGPTVVTERPLPCPCPAGGLPPVMYNPYGELPRYQQVGPQLEVQPQRIQVTVTPANTAMAVRAPITPPQKISTTPNSTIATAQVRPSNNAEIHNTVNPVGPIDEHMVEPILDYTMAPPVQIPVSNDGRAHIVDADRNAANFPDVKHSV